MRVTKGEVGRVTFSSGHELYNHILYIKGDDYMKTCNKCGNEFEGRHCKPCRNEYMREYHERKKNENDYIKKRKMWTKNQRFVNRARMLSKRLGHEIDYMEFEKAFERDGNECYYCGKGDLDNNDLHIDHKIPISRGGKTTVDNLVVACSNCNNRKYNKTDEEFIKWIRYGIKKCTRCGIEKHLSEYGNVHSTSDGKGHRCKECERECAKEYREKRKLKNV